MDKDAAKASFMAPTRPATRKPTMSETAEPRFAVHASRYFSTWLAGLGGSLAVSTYQAGKLLLLGTRPDGRLYRYAAR
jgi:hypothetical protein